MTIETALVCSSILAGFSWSFESTSTLIDAIVAVVGYEFIFEIRHEAFESLFKLVLELLPASREVEEDDDDDDEDDAVYEEDGPIVCVLDEITGVVSEAAFLSSPGMILPLI